MQPKTNEWLVDEPKRLANSKLWEIQKNYFAHLGVDAWKKEVPFYISSNSFVAKSYCIIILNHIKDWLRLNESKLIKQSKPLFKIFEFGAGTGRFSYYFLKNFCELKKQLSHLEFDFIYILSDVAEKNIDYCKKNSFFEPFIKQGILQCEVFDLCDVLHENKLAQVKHPIFSHIAELNTPPILIANYIFDVLKQDKFYVKDKNLYEVQYGIENRYRGFDANAPQSLKDLVFKQNSVLLGETPYYNDNELNAILEFYKNTLPNESTFLLPIAAIDFINLFTKISKDNYFLISGDKGICSESILPEIRNYSNSTFDGCHSFFVNYHAMGKYIKAKGGDFLFTAHHSDFKVNLFVGGGTIEKYENTAAAFNNSIESIGPSEYCALLKEFQVSGYRFKLDSLVAILRLSNYDPDTYGVIHDRLVELSKEIDEQEKNDLYAALLKVEDNVYSLIVGFDIYNLIGIFYQVMNDDKRALALFEKSLKVYGPTAPVHHNLGILYENRKDKMAAIYHFEKTLEIEKKNKLAKRKLGMLQRGGWYRLVIPLLKIMLVSALVVIGFYVLKTW